MGGAGDVRVLVCFLLLWLVFGCGGFLPHARPGDRNAKMVRYVVQTWNWMAWNRSGYARSQDVSAPFYTIMAADNTACVVFSPVVHLPDRGDYWACGSQWRYPR
jgi:hypothetical protein